MKDNDSLAIARYIFTTGRMVHDMVTRICTAAGMEKGKTSRFGELSAQQMNMILMVRFRQAVSVSELARLLGVSPPSVSTMVERLVERGLLTRTACQQDRRKVEIRVSPDAIADIARVEDMILGSFVELVEAVGPETTQKWCEVLQQVKQVLEKKQLSV
ncbi:Transcriptional regulator [Desulfosarcina cetonica]|uniref:MarR family winged helix-turn-helix transcriptional regulator n=1 Tax=Desulfosarcina cetonica TaxID=90730 RepID=UPI0006D11F4D|nr:MarR family transcriptional regulator [Desulfosarcina cetonica]VTR68985.1 Transcriptional regulator [Desulfosarcina cetonica]